MPGCRLWRRTAAAMPGSATRPRRGTTEANVEQQKYFTDVATKVVLPMFKESNKPFVLVFWSRDPDGTQHNQGDSLLKVEPGINGPTSLAAVKNADDNWRNCAPCSMNWDFRQTPISSSPPTTASRRYRRRAKPAAPPGHFIRACRRAIYRPGFSPSTSPMHWRCLCTIRTRKIPRSLPGSAARQWRDRFGSGEA